MKYKHIIFFLAVYFILLFPVMAMTPNIEYIGDVYSNRQQGGITYYGQLGYITYNGRFLFCLDPYKLVGTNYELNNDYFNNYDEDTLKYIKMVSNYVNKNLEVKNPHYYMAAQELIWERIIGNDMVYWTTKAKNEGSRINVDAFKNEIDSYVNNFLTKPSFDNITVSDNFFSTVILEDTNNVLMYYEVINNSKNNVWINGNKLYINILSSELSEIKLIRKYGEGSPMYYHKDSSQDLAALASYVENVSSIYVKANNEYNENINVEFIDRETNLLVGNIDFNLNKNSYNTFDGRYMTNLESGKYNINVTNVPYGYLLPDEYSFEINEENINPTRVLKVYLDKPIVLLRVKLKEEGLYQLYKKGVVDNLISTSSRSEEFKLDFFEYYVIDLINNKKYDMQFEYSNPLTKVIYYDLILSKNMDDNKKRNVINDISVKENNNDEKSVNSGEEVLQNTEQNVGNYENNSINYTLPNTFDYIKVIKIILIILCVILIIRHVKEIFKK